MIRTPRRDPTTAAISKVNAADTDRSTLRWAARTLFDAGEFDHAARGFTRLVDDDAPDLDALTVLTQIAGETGEIAKVLEVIDQVLRNRIGAISPNVKGELMRARFDLLDTPDVATTSQFLEALVETGSEAWSILASANRQAKVEAALPTDATAIPILEQWLYAPPASGWPGNAIARLEAIGSGHGATPSLSRDVERLLHLVGAVDAAYRVESYRRRGSRHLPSTSTIANEAPPTLPALCITIAGGHQALRSLARRDLIGHGIAEVREIPSAWEAVRDGRAVTATVAGSDLVVIVASQIAHSTIDQIKDAAGRYDLPITYIQVATLGAIRRAVELFSVKTSD